MRLIRQHRSRGRLKVQVPDLKYVFIQRDSGTDQKVTNYWSKVILEDFWKNVEGETRFISIFVSHKVEAATEGGETQECLQGANMHPTRRHLRYCCLKGNISFLNQVSKHWTRHTFPDAWQTESQPVSQSQSGSVRGNPFVQVFAFLLMRKCCPVVMKPPPRCDRRLYPAPVLFMSQLQPCCRICTAPRRPLVLCGGQLYTTPIEHPGLPSQQSWGFLFHC